jgi:broad specificity phosphatase PhoE
LITVHLLRHGQTAWNVERRFLGRTDIALDATGTEQVMRLASVFPSADAVYSSPLLRAWSTAVGVAGGAPLALDSGLVEMHMGVLEGLGAEEALRSYSELFQAFRADPSTVVIPEGETLAQASDRMTAAWTRIVVPSAPRTIAIVSHQMALSALLCRLTGAPLSAYRGFTQRNTAWSTVTVDPTRPLDPAGIHVIARDHAPHLVDMG